MALVQSKVNNTSPGAAAAIAFDSAVSAGSLLVVQVACYSTNANGAITVSDSVNGAWTVVYSNINTNNISAIAYFQNSASGTPTVTVTSSGTGNQYITAVQSEWSGMETTGSLDVSTSATGTSTTGSTGTTSSTTQNDTVSFAVISHENDADMSTPSGFTSLQLVTSNAVNQPATQSYRINTTQAAQSASITFSGTKNWVGGIAAFKVAAGGGGGGTAFIVNLMGL